MSVIEIIFLVCFLVGLIGLFVTSSDKVWVQALELFGTLLLYLQKIRGKKDVEKQMGDHVRSGRSRTLPKQ
tara:strand:- start:567 stop:779 length:213 start_codon:yes stop_codon:yes gene_type:complete